MAAAEDTGKEDVYVKCASFKYCYIYIYIII